MNDYITLDEVDKVAISIGRIRNNNPLLVIYYTDGEGIIANRDIRALYDTFRKSGWSSNFPHKQLDVLLNTYGGEPDAAYRLAQLIRDFSERVDFLIPFHSLSAGTIMSLCANRIVLGANAILGPIDVTVDDVELASIEYFRKFVLDTRRKHEDMFEESEEIPSTDVDSRMMVEMAKQVGALDIGSLYRQSTLTTKYATKLMHDYMFQNYENKEDLAKEVAESLVSDFPAHDFVLDYHMCLDLKLPVTEMTEEQSDITKQLIDYLNILSENGTICKTLPKNYGQDYKAPFLRLYGGNNLGRKKTT